MDDFEEVHGCASPPLANESGATEDFEILNFTLFEVTALTKLVRLDSFEDVLSFS